MKRYFSKIDGILYFILFFCAVGLVRNLLYLSSFGFDYASAPTKVFIAMSVIYGVQCILILMRRREAFIISAIQVFFCFYVYGDYTFLPFANGFNLFLEKYFPNLNYGWAVFCKTIIASALFSLEILKTYLLYVLTQEPRKKKRKSINTNQAQPATPAQ